MRYIMKLYLPFVALLALVPWIDATTICKETTNGVEYRGTVAVTKSGKICQAWTSQTPHEHTRNDVDQFPAAKYNEANYCRNPDNEGKSPWCYTTDPSTRWELCDVPECADVCQQQDIGMDYRGNLASTKTGKTCQAWATQSPHAHTRNDVNQFPDAINNEANYCRNPDREGTGPWCYTTDPASRWEYCDVVYCSGCRKTKRGVEYRGDLAKTKSGKTCQAWTSQTPHEHTRNDVDQFPAAKYNEANYCRNPDNEGKRPWCYTTDPSKRWQYCAVPKCADCKKTTLGMDYRGNVAKTTSGKTCQAWAAQSPHEHTRNDVNQFPDAINNEANYCRNPDREGTGPWCYTTDPASRWEYCKIPSC